MAHASSLIPLKAIQISTSRIPTILITASRPFWSSKLQTKAKSFSKLSPFTIEKGLQGCIRTALSAKKLRSGCLIV